MVIPSKSWGQCNHKQWCKSQLLVCWWKFCHFFPSPCLLALTSSHCPPVPRSFAQHLGYFNVLLTDFSASNLSTPIYAAEYFQTSFSKTQLYHVESYGLVLIISSPPHFFVRPYPLWFSLPLISFQKSNPYTLLPQTCNKHHKSLPLSSFFSFPFSY